MFNVRKLLLTIAIGLMVVGCDIPINSGDSNVALEAENELLKLKLENAKLAAQLTPAMGASTPTPPPTPTPTPSFIAPTPNPITTPYPANRYSSDQLAEMFGGAVVTIRNKGACGTGVITGSYGLVVTNYHVVEGGNGTNGEYTAILQDGTTLEAHLEMFDEIRDLALIRFSYKLHVGHFKEWPEWKSTNPKLGEQIVVLGYPASLANLGCSADPNLTITSGVVSALPNIGGQQFIQTDAALNPGVSGGLALTMDGEVAGLAVSGVPLVEENVGFLIPPDELNPLVDEWRLASIRGQWLPTPTPVPGRAIAPRPQIPSYPTKVVPTPRPAPTATRVPPTPTVNPTHIASAQQQQRWWNWINRLKKEAENWPGPWVKPPGRKETCTDIGRRGAASLCIGWYLENYLALEAFAIKHENQPDISHVSRRDELFEINHQIHKAFKLRAKQQKLYAEAWEQITFEDYKSKHASADAMSLEITQIYEKAHNRRQSYGRDNCCWENGLPKGWRP